MNKGLNTLEVLLIFIGGILAYRGSIKNEEISNSIFNLFSKLGVEFIDIRLISFFVAKVFILFWCASIFLYYRRVKQ